MSNETLKTSNKRRLSGEEAKSYISIFLLLYIHREHWASSAFCFHTTATPQEAAVVRKQRKYPSGEANLNLSEPIRVLSDFSIPVDGL